MEKRTKEGKFMEKKSFVLIMILLALLAAPLFGGGQEEKELIYGMTIRDASPPYAQAMIRGAQMQAEKLGVKIIVSDSQNDIIKQLEQIDSFLTRGVNGLIFGGTIDTAAVIPGIKKCNER